MSEEKGQIVKCDDCGKANCVLFEYAGGIWCNECMEVLKKFNNLKEE